MERNAFATCIYRDVGAMGGEMEAIQHAGSHPEK
jgi:hypothetical protein